MKYKIFKFKKHLFEVNKINEFEINPIATLSSSRNKLFVNLFKKIQFKIYCLKIICSYAELFLKNKKHAFFNNFSLNINF
jgi:hypothetical protein